MTRRITAFTDILQIYSLRTIEIMALKNFDANKNGFRSMSLHYFLSPYQSWKSICAARFYCSQLEMKSYMNCYLHIKEKNKKIIFWGIQNLFTTIDL